VTSPGPAADHTPFGDDLARAVVGVLRNSRYYHSLGAVVRAHRDYTGHGLFHDRDTDSWFLASTYDGLPDPAPLISFADADSFAAWLARQSDAGLSGVAAHADMADAAGFARDPGNQRITREFLQAAVAPR